MSNQCPADHPAVALVKRASLANGSSRKAGTRTAPSSSSAMGTPPRTCWARCALITASLMQLALVVAIVGLPTVSPGAADLLKLARLECSVAGSTPPTATGRALALDSTRAILSDAAAADVRQVASVSVTALYAGLLGAARASASRALSSSTAAGGGLQAKPSAPATAQAAGPAAGPAAADGGAASSSLGALSSKSGIGLLTATDGGLLTGLQLEGQLDMGDMVLGILVACVVLVVIALLGLCVACSRPHTCGRTLAAALYFVTSLPVWVALGFAVAFCFVFRAEAEVLVRRYWLCLLLTEPAHVSGAARTAWGAASAVYQSITLTASLLLACNVLLLAGLFFASRVIGVGTVSANLLKAINCGQVLVGLGLCAVAAGLHSRSEGSVHADIALLALGGSVFFVSSLGLLGAHCHSRCLLRLYGACTALVTLGLVGFVAGLTVLGVKGLSDSSFLAANWHYVRDIYPISKEDFLKLLGRHWSKLMIASCLLATVQLLVLLATCLLRRALVPSSGGGETLYRAATASERKGLTSVEDDDDDDLTSV